MPKKRKKKEHSHKPKAAKASADVRTSVLSAIKTLGKEASLRTIFPPLIKKHSQEQIVLALNELDRAGIIQIGQKGIIKMPGSLPPSKESRSRAGSKTLSGTIDITRSGSAFVTIEGMEKDVFIPPRAVHNAMQSDLVKIRITQAGRRPEGEVISILRRAQDSFAGRIEVLEKFAFFIADERKLNTDVFVPLTALKGAKNEDRAIVRITDWNTGDKKPIGEVVEVLSIEKGSDYDMKLILIQNGFSIDFPLEVYRELEKYTDQIPPAEVKKRLDFRKVLTFTIDPEDAKDFDDAISFRQLSNGHFEVGVHIADVSHFVTENSALDKEAEKRATSVYLPDRVCPMLPEKLSNLLCSLRPHEDKLTYAAIFEVDEKFNVTNQTIARTIINSDRRFTYEQAQEVLETGKGDYAKELQLLNQMAKSLREKRFRNGAIAFEKDEVKFKLDETGKPIGVFLKVRKEAHLLVEDFMLLANESVAKFGARLNKGKHLLPFVYRIHDRPDPERLAQFAAVAARFGYSLHFDNDTDIAATFNGMLKKVEGKPEQHVIETLAIRSMAKASYTTNNIGHYGLAMEYYTHFTSPIRRYPDVMVHRLLTHILDHSDGIVVKEELEERCKNSSLMERKAMDAEREAVKYKQIEYLQDKVGEEYEGIISGVIMKGVFVELIENKCEGMVSVELLGDEDFAYDEKMIRLTGIRSKRRFELGGKIRVKILSADLALRRIDMALAE